MLTVETETSMKKQANDYFIDRQCADDSLNSSLKSNLKPTMREDISILSKDNSTKSIRVTKAYKMVNGTIEECYFEDNYSGDEFITEFANDLKKGLILVIHNELSAQEIKNLGAKIKTNLVWIIYYNKKSSESINFFGNSAMQMNSKSLKSAITEAYNLAKDGQSILVPKVNVGFDLFSHIDFK